METLQTTLTEGAFRGAVISSENLSSVAGAKLFEGLTEMFEIHVIYYVRRQDEWIESAWKQWGLKTGVDISEYAEKQIRLGRPDYLERARAWREVSAHMHVVPLGSTPDITTDFWDALELVGFTPQTTARQNQTFDWSILDILSSNSHLFSNVQDNSIFNLLERLLPEDMPREGRGLLPPRLSQEIMDSHREANDLLQLEFFPELNPLDEYPGPPYSDKARGGWGSVAGIHRYLGFELLMLKELENELAKSKSKAEKFDEISRFLETQVNHVLPEQFDRMNADLAKLKKMDLAKLIKTDLDELKKENKSIRKQNKFLQRKIEEIDKKMARSIKWKIKKIFRKLGDIFSKKNN